ncbi:MAG: lysozyme inhibitor LprI family protein [Methylococcales bacterium]|nr:lysozyme inhibitor LprI family protein [Methylococcales bacterium]
MNFKKIFSIGFVLLCFAQIVFAQDKDLRKQYTDCLDKSNGVTSEMLDCIGIETKYQDERLNKAYKALMPQLSEARKKELQEAQRLWIKYRDANSRFYADPDGGTIATITSNDTFLTMTAERASELEELAKY